MPEKSSFKIGTNVVYPSHGVGKVVKVEDQDIGGSKIKFLVIHFEKDKLDLRVPLAKAQKVGVRAIASKKEMDKVLTILSEKPKINRGIWSKRALEYEAKINSGSLTSIAEVVRDLFKDPSITDRSYSEKVIYDLALSRLSGEYALLYNLDSKTALNKILEIIKEKQPAA